MIGFQFDEATHQYHLDGTEIPGVTRILNDMGMNDTEWFKDHHRRRGTAVHLACELAARGSLDLDKTHEKISAYARQFIEWQARVKYQPLLIEKAMGSKLWRYGGKLDHFGTMEYEGRRRHCLIDIKSGAVPPSIWYQLHLYLGLLEDNWEGNITEPVILASLKLTDDRPDKYRFRVFDGDPTDRAVALSLVKAWHFRNKHKLLKGKQQ